MTEAEWLMATDPTPMLEFLRGKASDRKLDLLMSAHAHRSWSKDDELSGVLDIESGLQSRRQWP